MRVRQEAEQMWTAKDLPDLSGRRAIITGANSGIGYEAARELALHGSALTLAVRNEDKGLAAAAVIRREYPKSDIEVMALDLASLASIRQFAAVFQKRHERLSLLINNAGVMAVPYSKTVDGFERQFGTNHLGHFALTGLLLPTLLAAPGGRVVTVASAAHAGGKIDFDNLDGSKQYHRWAFYSQSKLANVLFAYELQRRLAAHRLSAISVACHPGFAATNLTAAGMGSRRKWIGQLVGGIANLMAQSAAMGALPTLYAATAADLTGGEYIGPTGRGGMRGYPGEVKSSQRSHDTEAANRLWLVSETLTDVHYL